MVNRWALNKRAFYENSYGEVEKEQVFGMVCVGNAPNGAPIYEWQVIFEDYPLGYDSADDEDYPDEE